MRAPIVRRPSSLSKAIAAACAGMVSFAVLAGVVALFAHDGTPYERAVVAERACSDHVFVSDRARCMEAFMASAQHPAIAGH